MKKRVRLTESQFRSLIGKCVKRVLNEGLNGEAHNCVRQLYNALCEWQDSVPYCFAGTGDENEKKKLSELWNKVDKEWRPFLDSLMYGNN